MDGTETTEKWRGVSTLARELPYSGAIGYRYIMSTDETIGLRLGQTHRKAVWSPGRGRQRIVLARKTTSDSLWALGLDGACVVGFHGWHQSGVTNLGGTMQPPPARVSFTWWYRIIFEKLWTQKQHHHHKKIFSYITEQIYGDDYFSELAKLEIKYSTLEYKNKFINMYI